MTVRARDLRLVPIAVAAWVAAAASLLMPSAVGWMALGLWAAVGVVLAAALVIRGRQRMLVLAVIALAVAAAAVSNTALAQPSRVAASALGVDGGRAVEVTAVVAGKAGPTSTGRLRFDARASVITIGTEHHDVDVPIVVLGALPGPAGLDVGAVVVVAGTTFRADAADRAVLVVDASRDLVVVSPPDGVMAVAAGLRSGLVDAVSGLPEPGAGLVPGLAVGDTSAVSSDLDAAMKQSSLSHLTAVSGANCAIVVGLAFALAALCGARRGVRVAVSLAVLAGFVVLVTPEPSVVRSAVMAAIAMLAVALGRAGSGLSLLCLAVACTLVADPWLAASLGFALSVAATASLLVLARPLAAGLQRAMPRALAFALSVPIAAQLACGPLLVLINPVVPLYGIVANLLAGPAAPAATIAGLAACLAAPFPALQSGLAALAWLPAAWIAATADVLAGMPGGQLPWLDGPAGLVVLAVVGAGVTVLIVGGRGKIVVQVRVVAGGIVAAVVGIGAGVGALGSVAGPLTVPPGWVMLACDIGQGDAVLLRSGSSIALVDTGPEPDALRACLARVGIAHIDLLVLTHYDLDHAGGVDAVTGMVDTVLHGPPADAVDRGILSRLSDAGADVIDAYQGLHGTLGAAQWRVVWPPQHSVAFPSGNDASVVVDLRAGGVSMLLLGDMGASSQRALAASGALRPPYTVVKVAHHGSADQDAGLYRLLRPTVAVISVGQDNDYGHPRAETVTMLAGIGATVARTDTGGVVAVVVAESGVSLWRERGPPAVVPAG